MLLNSMYHSRNNVDIFSHKDNSLLLQTCVWLLNPSFVFLLLNVFVGERVKPRVKLLKELFSF